MNFVIKFLSYNFQGMTLFNWFINWKNIKSFLLRELESQERREQAIIFYLFLVLYLNDKIKRKYNNEDILMPSSSKLNL